MTTVTAMPHVRTSPVQRSRGHSAVAAAAYRQGERFTDERTGEVHDFRARGGVEDGFIVAPEGAEWALDRERLWNAAEAAERRSNSQTAREYIVALPHELNREERREVAQQFARELVQRYGVAVDVAIHAPSREGDQRNWHMHVLTTTRRVDEEGLGEKTRELDDQKQGPKEILALRERLAQIENDALRLAQVDRQVDHRRHKERGIEREADRDHLGRERMAERREATKEMAEIRGELAAMGIGAKEGQSLEPRAQAAETAREVEGWIEAAQRQVQQLRERAAAQIERAKEAAREKAAQVGEAARDVWQATKERLGVADKPTPETMRERFQRIEAQRAAESGQTPLTAAERLARAEALGQKQREGPGSSETPRPRERPRGQSE